MVQIQAANLPPRTVLDCSDVVFLFFFKQLSRGSYLAGAVKTKGEHVGTRQKRGGNQEIGFFIFRTVKSPINIAELIFLEATRFFD